MTVRLILLAAAVLAAAASVRGAGPQPGRRPNVILIITDDQGFGDAGFNGNPVVRTPHLDRLAAGSVRFRSFYVSPVCSPTRASLLTGRYNYRTGVVDTFLGRSLMHPAEVTLAEVLRAAGYRTGIFGKWHLGDNYPLRAMDQGFDESLTLNGGGIGQPSDPPGGESYFDPLLRRNGRWVKTTGYVSDVITDAAIAFVKAGPARPFFAYLAFNAPHTPLQVPPEKYDRYRAADLGVERFPASGHPIAPGYNADTTARVYGMVENIDDNIGRLLAALDERGLAEDTILIFLSDNGPQQPRYNAGLLRLKGTVYEGGIRVPFLVRWPRRLAPREVDRIAAHIDVTPTVLELAGAAPPAQVQMDGRSLVPLLDGRAEAWPDRALFFQWHRGDAPQAGRAFAVRTQAFKLVQAQGTGEGAPVPDTAPALFDMAADPLERTDVAAAHPEVVARLRRDYDAWFSRVTGARDYSDAGIARIAIGSGAEDPVRLTRQDWRGRHAGWTPTSAGYWEIDVRRGGRYDLSARIAPQDGPATLHVRYGRTAASRGIPVGAGTVSLTGVRLPRRVGRLDVYIERNGRRTGVLDVTVARSR